MAIIYVLGCKASLECELSEHLRNSKFTVNDRINDIQCKHRMSDSRGSDILGDKNSKINGIYQVIVNKSPKTLGV